MTIDDLLELIHEISKLYRIFGKKFDKDENIFSWSVDKIKKLFFGKDEIDTALNNVYTLSSIGHYLANGERFYSYKWKLDGDPLLERKIIILQNGSLSIMEII